ncbi:MAG: hypothetical protein MUC49_18655 [Raineya sp.]|jgi:hypothetical protein|nr:hypothetical protein [Raineya sp.]
MEALEVKGFSKAFQTDKKLVLARKWGAYIVYLLPLAFGLMGLQMISISIGSVIIFSVPLLYFGLSGIINTVVFTFSSEGIKIQNQPIPWFLPPDRLIPKSEIKQVMVKESVRKKNGSVVSRDYDVIVKLNNRKDILIKSYGDYPGKHASSNANKVANLILKHIQ